MFRAHTILALITLALVSSCGDSVTSLADENIEAMNDLTRLLGDIKTKAEAESATGEINEILDQIQEIKTRSAALMKDMSETEKVEFARDHAKRHEEAAGRLGKEMARIAANPELHAALDSVVEKFRSLK